MSIEEAQEEYVSKQDLKQEMVEIQDLALKLVELSPSEFNQISLDPDLRAQIELTKKIKSHSAKRRQLRFLTQFIHRSDPDEIRAALLTMTDGNRAANSQFRVLEKLRDKVATGNHEAIELVVAKFAAADRQHLRNLQRNCKKEKTEEGVSRAKRTIYHYLCELQSASSKKSIID